MANPKQSTRLLAWRLLATAALLGSCSAPGDRPLPIVATAPSDSSVPEDWAVERQWVSNRDGYVFSVGYFTPEQERSAAWEQKRLESNGTARFCDGRLARREVRWFEPEVPGEPRCAKVIYGFSCPGPRAVKISSLGYDVKQMTLEEPETPIEHNCGEKDDTKRPKLWVTPTRADGPIVSSWLDCDQKDDLRVGKIRLDEVTYINVRSLASLQFIQRSKGGLGGGAGYLSAASLWDQKFHLVIVDRPLKDDGHNLFVEQTVAADGDGFCISLTARQGQNIWRKTLRLPNDDEGFAALQADFPSSHRTDTNDLSRTLQYDLADYLGIDTSKARKASAGQS